MPNRRTVLIGMVALPMAALFARRAYAKKPEIFTGIVRGKAAGGYDVVAYFTEGKPVKGSPRFTMQWKGAAWDFASSANLEKFRASPEGYAPQYGGHCAYGLANGYLVKGDPQQWRIVNGRLFLNYSADVQSRWIKDIPGYVQASDKRWPDILK